MPLPKPAPSKPGVLRIEQNPAPRMHLRVWAREGDTSRFGGIVGGGGGGGVCEGAGKHMCACDGESMSVDGYWIAIGYRHSVRYSM